MALEEAQQQLAATQAAEKRAARQARKAQKRQSEQVITFIKETCHACTCSKTDLCSIKLLASRSRFINALKVTFVACLACYHFMKHFALSIAVFQ